MRNRGFDRKIFGDVMRKVCPSDAALDEEMKRLLAELDRQCRPKGERKDESRR